MAQKKYELVFSGSADTRGYKFPRYRRFHASLGSAEAAADAVKEKLDMIQHPHGGTITACHSPIVYGPGCGDSGRPLRW